MSIPRRDLVPRGRVPRQTLLYARVPQDGVANILPVAEFSSAAGADTLSFDFTDESTDADGTIVSWDWDFGDGIGTSTDQHPTYSYPEEGLWTVTLTVTDNHGGIHQVQHDVTAASIAPTFRAVGAKADGIGDITPAPHASHVSGDYELLVVETTQNDTAVLGTANGFTAVAASPQVAAGCKLFMWERFWNGTDGSPVVTDPGNHALGYILSFKDVSSAYVLGSGIVASQVPLACPGGTTDHTKQLVVACVAYGTDTDTPQVSSPANADLTGVAIIGDYATSQGGGGGVVAIAGAKATAGSVGTTSGTFAATTSQGCIAMALRARGSSV